MQRPAHVFWILYRPSWATNPPSCPGANSIRSSGPKASSKASRCSNWKSLSAEKLPVMRLARKTEHRGRCSSRRDSNSSESWYIPVHSFWRNWSTSGSTKSVLFSFFFELYPSLPGNLSGNWSGCLSRNWKVKDNVNPGLINPVYGCLIGRLPFMYHLKWLLGGYSLINKPWFIDPVDIVSLWAKPPMFKSNPTHPGTPVTIHCWTPSRSHGSNFGAPTMSDKPENHLVGNILI